MKLGQTSVIYFLSRITASILGFGATLYFARDLGAEPLGIYSLVLGVVSWLSIIGTLGVPTAVSKRVSEGSEQKEYVAAGLVLVGLLTTILLLGVAIFRGQLDAYIGYPAAKFVALILLISLVSQVVLSTLHGLHLVEIQGFLSTLRTGIRSSFQIGILALGGGLIGMFLGFAAGYLITLVVGGILVLRRLDGIKKPARSHLRSLVDFAKFAWISDIRSKAFNWLDVIILGFFVSSSLIGIYTIAWNIAQFLIIFSSSISQTVFPEMSQISANKNAQATAELFEQATLYAGLVLIPGVIGSVVVGERILRIYGPEFIKGIVVLTILIIANLIQAYQNQILTTLNAVDRPDLAFRVNLVFLLGNLVLNIVLIYFYGWLGAAVATSLSALLSLIAGFAYLRSIISLSLPSMEIMKQWAAAITMGILVYTLQRAENAADLINHNVTTLLALVGIGAIAYFLILAGISEPFRSTIRRNLPITEPNLPW